jgi:hypothetical protein
MSGFGTEATDLLTAAFGDQGFIPTGAAAAGRAGDMPYEGPLKPGDAIGVNFVTGDFLLGGTGTVTHIDGDQVYAFGRPMATSGPTEFPMTRAYVYTVLPSLYSSSNRDDGETIGTFLHDRPRRSPSSRCRRSSGHSDARLGSRPKRTFHFGVVRDQLFRRS